MNIVAYRLVCFASFYGGEHIWLEETLECVGENVQANSEVLVSTGAL